MEIYEKLFKILLISLVFVLFNATKQPLYGERLCEEDSHYFCFKVRLGDTWESLWPDPITRQETQKLNRLNIPLRESNILAIPNFPVNHFNDFCPFEIKIDDYGGKIIIWDPYLLAWAAYDERGDLVRWGPGVGGMDYCADIHRNCQTITGQFTILYIGGPYYRSSTYPIGCKNNCAILPYAMFFNSKGYALHAGKLPGKHASHGCIRLFTDDAKWLNENFVEIDTPIIIYPYN